MSQFRQVIQLGVIWRALVFLAAVILIGGMFLGSTWNPIMLTGLGLYAVAGLVAIRHRAVLTASLSRASVSELGEVLDSHQRAPDRLTQLSLGDILVRGLPRVTQDHELSLEEWGIVASMVSSKRPDLATASREAVLRSQVTVRELLDHQARILVDTAWFQAQSKRLILGVVLFCGALLIGKLLVFSQYSLFESVFTAGLMATFVWFLSNSAVPKSLTAKDSSVVVELARNVASARWFGSRSVREHSFGLAVMATYSYENIALDDWILLLKLSRQAGKSERFRILQGAKMSAPVELLPALAAEAEYWSSQRSKASHEAISAITAARLAIASRPPELAARRVSVVQEVP